MIINITNYSYGDFETFLHDNDDRIYRMWEYKKFLDSNNECPFTDDYCRFVLIRELIELPNGDFLLGLQGVDYDNDEENYNIDKAYIEYYKMSDVFLAYCYKDQFRYVEENEG